MKNVYLTALIRISIDGSDGRELEGLSR